MAQNKTKKSLPLYLRRLGHPACHGEEGTSPPSGPPSILTSPLSSSSCPLLFVQPGGITWGREGQTWGPNHPGFHLRPIFLDDRLGIKPGPKTKLKLYKNGQKTGTDWSFDHLLGTQRPLFWLNGWTALTHLSECGHARISYVLWEHSAATAHVTPCYTGSTDTFPFPGEHLKCTTLLLSFFILGLKLGRSYRRH